ncbi:MAG: hypothetical protein QOH18_1806, partial [Solirubrobacterales bacterium]|nr:hypothetical protein [Solirubrobacterales bacterium]
MGTRRFSLIVVQGVQGVQVVQVVQVAREFGTAVGAFLHFGDCGLSGAVHSYGSRSS